MTKLISVAMTTYNGEKYLKEQLDSIYNQTYKNIEVIVCDDCSNDSTKDILEEYSQKFGLKYYINNKNLGVTKNFEKAISLCSGEYIALSDQDDIWLEDKLEYLLNEIGESSVIFSNAEIIDGNSNSKNTTTHELYPLFKIDKYNSEQYYKIILQGILLGSSTLFKQELVTLLIPIYKSSRNHDWWLQICAHQLSGIKYTQKVLFKYRHHENNVSRKNDSKENKYLLSYFSNENKLKRKEKIEEQLNIVNLLLEKKYYKNENEKIFLIDIQDYCNSRLNSIIHFKAFAISIKYRKHMFHQKSRIKRLINLLTRLVS